MSATRIVVLGVLAALAASNCPASGVELLGGKDPDKKATSKKEDDKPAVEGTFQFGSKTYKLQHGLAYKNKFEDEVTTVVYLTEKAFPATALKSLKEELRKNGNDEEFFIFDPFFFVRVTTGDETEPSINVMLPNGGGFNVTEDQSKVKVSGDRVQGHMCLPEPQKVFDTQYRFDLKFDLRLLGVEG
jgi:hypothetical protein